MSERNLRHEKMKKAVAAVLPCQFCLEPSNGGGCVLTGFKDTSFSVKLGPQGQILWDNRYGGDDIICYDIKNTSDGGYIACGADLEIAFQYGYVLKIDSTGNL
jgi:hypothetical protein